MTSVIDQIVERKASIDAGEFMALGRPEEWYESALMKAARKLQELFLSNMSRRVKVTRLQAIVSEFQENPLAHRACKKGCSNCCHQPVMLSQTEADAIGQKIDRKPVRLKASHVMKELNAYGRETPCTFLVGNACSIYESRPFICRKYVNSDKDSLLCSFENWDLQKANDPRSVHIPMPNAELIQQAYVAISGTDVYGDIRDFFPLVERAAKESTGEQK